VNPEGKPSINWKMMRGSSEVHRIRHPSPCNLEKLFLGKNIKQILATLGTCGNEKNKSNQDTPSQAHLSADLGITANDKLSV
jgi:hypothetical protein